MKSLALEISRDGTKTLLEQLVAGIKMQIIDGILASGSRLPPTRNLAELLKISRSTVVAAYEQLEAEGFIYSKTGSGTFVVPLALEQKQTENRSPYTTKGRGGTVEASIFRPGSPDMRLFPHKKWARYQNQVARHNPELLVNTYPDFGDPVLREAIAQHLWDWRGLKCSGSQILITAGAAEAVDISLRLLCGSGDGVALENPGYSYFGELCQTLRLSPHFMDVSTHERLLPPDCAQVAILTPSHQFPLGGSMSINERQAFIRWANEHDAWLIEDDFDSEFRFSGTPIPAMTAYDQVGRCLYVGSFSKIFSTGLKLGYVVVPEQLLELFYKGLKNYPTKAASPAQRPLALFLRDGEFTKHLKRMRRHYAERRALVLNLLKGPLAEITRFKDHGAGMQIAVYLPSHVDEIAVSGALKEAGIDCPPLSSYCFMPIKRPGLLVGFCSNSVEELTEKSDDFVQIIKQAATV